MGAIAFLIKIESNSTIHIILRQNTFLFVHSMYVMAVMNNVYSGNTWTK